MADEIDTLAEQIVIDDAQALQSLANFIASLTTAQEKLTGLQNLVDVVAAKMGQGFDAAKQKVLELSDELNGATFSGKNAGREGFSLGFDAQTIERFNQVTQSAGAAETAFRGDTEAITAMNAAAMNTVPVFNAWQQTLTGYGGLDTARQKINLLKQAIQQYSAENGVSFEKAAVAVRKAGEQMGIFTDTTNKHTVQALKELENGAIGVTGELERLGTMFVRVWTAMLAFQVVQWVMQLFTGFKQAVAAGLEFANTMQLVVVAVRDLQSAGMVVTIQEANQAIIDLKKQFPIFTEQDIAANLRDILMKTQGMNLSFADTVKIAEMAMGTSFRMGKTFGESADSIIKSLVNINQQSKKNMLEFTGIGVSAAEVVAKAQELGYENAEKGYKALNDQEKAYATLMVWVDKYADKQGDINTLMDTTAVKAKTLSATWADASKNLGLVIEELPAFKTALEFLNGIIPVLTSAFVVFFSVVLSGFETMLLPLAAVEGYFTGVWASILSGNRNAMDGIKAGIAGATEAVKQLKDLIGSTAGMGANALKGQLPTPTSPLGNNPIGPIIPGEESNAEDLAKIVQDAEEEIIRIRDQSAAKQEQIERDKNEKLEDLALKHARAMEDLAIDEVNKTNEIKIDTANDIAKANEKARRDDIEAEEKYQLQMQELRENFMLSLEEALRSRDARSIIRLINQYDLEKKQAAAKYKLDTEQRHEADAQEIEDINRQEQIKLAELHREIQERRDALNKQYEQEKADVETWRKRQLEDLAKDTKDRLQQWADLLLAQHKLTRENIDAIYADMKTAFGPNGYVDQLYAYLLARMMQMQAAAASVAQSLGNVYSGNNPSPSSPHGYANGGTLFADTPKTVTFGEAGPEVAMFIPLRNSLGAPPSSFINGKVGAAGSLQLSLLLSPELEARITQTTLSNVALSIDRMQRQQ